MRSDSEFLQGFSAGVFTGVVFMGLVMLLTSCTAALVPSGKPGCPNRTLWSDSAQRCIAREGAVTDTVSVWIAELRAAGWKPKRFDIWQSPQGSWHRGPYTAWKLMREISDAPRDAAKGEG